MKKISLALALVTTSFFGAKAQMTSGDFTFGAGVHVGIPTGDLNTSNSFGIGGELQGEYAFTENISGVATSGYTTFFGKTVSGSAFGTSYSYKYPASGEIPILVGARFYPAEQFFVGAQIGYGIWTGAPSGASYGGGFEYRPQVGYNADQFQVILSYDASSVSVSAGGQSATGTFAHIGLTGIYKFGGGK
jgi:hypothetical protein